MPTIYPSLMAANPLMLLTEIATLEPYVDGFHIDLMDGHFVPHIMGGELLISALRATIQKRLWVHLMVEQPERLLHSLTLFPGDMVSMHYESFCGPRHSQSKKRYPNDRCSAELYTACSVLRSRNIRASIALCPHTPLEAIEHISGYDDILLLSAEPGTSGKVMDQQTPERLSTLQRMRTQLRQQFTISMEGGITPQSLAALHTLPDQLACGQAIFAHPDRIEAVQQLKKCLATGNNIL